MTREEKDLLLKDLCARLPYGVKVRYSSYYEFITCTLQAINPVYNTIDLWSKDACFNPVFIDKIKPYLFPLSSMTEEQMCELLRLRNQQYFVLREYTGTYKDSIPHCIGERNVIDWLNKNHFDYRGLIPMGMAIDATGLNIY